MAETFENNRKQNLSGLWANPRKRTMILIMVGLVGAMLLIGLFSGGSQKPTDAGTGTKSVDAPIVQARPGAVTDRDYTKAIEDENRERLEKARQQGTTVLPTLQGTGQAPSLDPLANAPAPSPAPQVVTPQPIVTPPSASNTPPPPPVQQAPAAPAPSAVDLSKTARYKSVESQIMGYMKAWGAPTGAQEFAYNGVRPETVAAPGSSVNGAASAQTSAAEAAKPRSGAMFVRAGTVVPAVLLTAINSDTPGPVLAQITSGPLAGARLLGSFQASEKQVVVQFRTLSMPSEPRSFSVNAYAVSESLSTGLATDVNNHYFRRYGLMLAAGFIQGYGQAVARSGTTTTVTNSGGVIITQDDLNSRQIAKVALGQAGASVANDIQQETRVRPTVKVEGKDGSGVPIGLLFMNDF